MDICYIAQANSPHTFRWISPIVERGHRVRLFSYVPVTSNWDDIEVIDLTRSGNTGKSRFLYWANHIRRALKSDGTDILHAHQIQGAGWLGTLAGQHPFVVTAWGSDILVNPFASRVSKILTRTVMNRCDALTVPTQHMYESALSLAEGYNKLVLLPWGVDPSPYRPRNEDRAALRMKYGIGSSAKVILSPRGLRTLYNHETVIDAFNQIMPYEPNLRLVMVKWDQPGNIYEALRDRIRHYGIEHMVSWLPYQSSPEAVGEMYRMGDILVSIPSTEGYGFTVYEAMAAGCPTIVSDLPVFEKNFKDGVHTVKVPIRDVSSTASALRTLLNDDLLRRQIRENALALTNRMSPQKQALRTEQLYEALVHHNETASVI